MLILTLGTGFGEFHALDRAMIVSYNPHAILYCAVTVGWACMVCDSWISDLSFPLWPAVGPRTSLHAIRAIRIWNLVNGYPVAKLGSVLTFQTLHALRPSIHAMPTVTVLFKG